MTKQLVVYYWQAIGYSWMEGNILNPLHKMSMPN